MLHRHGPNRCRSRPPGRSRHCRRTNPGPLPVQKAICAQERPSEQVEIFIADTIGRGDYLIDPAGCVSPPPIGDEQQRSGGCATLVGLVVVAEQATRLERVGPGSAHRREEHEPPMEFLDASRVAEREHLLQWRPLIGPHRPRLLPRPPHLVISRSWPGTCASRSLQRPQCDIGPLRAIRLSP